jgi:hypothetical protein
VICETEDDRLVVPVVRINHRIKVEKKPRCPAGAVEPALAPMLRNAQGNQAGGGNFAGAPRRTP